MALKVYYIDDEPDLLELFADLFSSKEIEIKTFADPLKAVEVIRSEPPDLVFIDYRLPKISSLELAAQIGAQIPKALITGDLLSRPDGQFAAIFEKPYREEAIEEFIRRYAKPSVAA